MEINITQIQNIETQMLKEIDRILTKHGIYYMIHAGSVLGAIRHKGPIPWDDDVDVVAKWDDMSRIVHVLREELPPHFGVDFHDINKRYDPMFPRVCLKNSSSDIVHVDIFPLVGLPNERKRQERFSRISDRINYLHRFYFKDISKVEGKVKKIIAFGIKMFVRLFPRSVFINFFGKHCSKHSFDQARYVMNSCGQRGLKNIFEKSILLNTIRVQYDGLNLPIPKAYDFYLRQYYKNYMELPPVEEQLAGCNETTIISDKDYYDYQNWMKQVC